MPVTGRSVLEVGCGPGGNLSCLEPRGTERLAGCDIIPKMVELASRSGVEVVLVDSGRLPFGDREFDLVFTVTVVQHNPDEDAAALIGEMCRVSRSDVFLIEDTGPREGYDSYVRRPVAEYVEMARRHSFDLVRSEPLCVRASERLHHVLSRFFDRRDRHEGEPLPRSLVRAEQCLLPVTQLIDQVAGTEGLTLLEFRRL
jgi:SAM-dependent methyltransferase